MVRNACRFAVLEVCSLIVVLQAAEELHRNRRGDHQQTHGEQNDGAELLARTKNFATKRRRIVKGTKNEDPN